MNRYQITYMGKSMADCYMAQCEARSIGEALVSAEKRKDIKTDRIVGITEIARRADED